ncbi:hypothetical protein [Amnibacterium endophyticum]|uniref:Major facilitator superfamily (MFS) profile domain-containing protein n=1 Tax=Amnibacterium endophyticum TaxID=2109337 RepID=A0ABW4LGF6_9MICO
MRLISVLLLAGGLGSAAGFVGGGLTGLVWGVVSWSPFVVWFALVSAFAGALVGSTAGVAAAASSALMRRAGVPALLGRVVVALSGAVAGVAAAVCSFGSYLASPEPTIGGIVAVTALTTGIAMPVLDKLLAPAARGGVRQTAS